MPQAMPLTTRVSQGSSRKRINRVLKAQFGDGYSQEAPDGTNSKYDEWAIAFENLDSTERTTVLTALDAVGGSDYLTWTAQGDGASKKWKVKDGYTEIWVSGTHSTINFEIRQIF
jgi:phage-related protein